VYSGGFVREVWEGVKVKLTDIEEYDFVCFAGLYGWGERPKSKSKS